MTKLEIIEAFVRRTCARAESNIKKTGKLEGAHYAAMMVELKLAREKFGKKDEKQAPSEPE